MTRDYENANGYESMIPPNWDPRAQPGRTKKSRGYDNNDNDTCTWASMGAVVLVIFLVLIVLGSAVGYGGLGYYDNNNNNNRDPMPYNSNMWWCHYCSGRSCPSVCWS